MRRTVITPRDPRSAVHLELLFADPLLRFLCLLPIGVSLALLGSQQELYAGYFRTCGFVAFLVGVAYLAEAVVAYPVVFGLVPRSREVPSAHDKNTIVRAQYYRGVNLFWPTLVRHCLTTTVGGLLGLILFVAGIATFVWWMPNQNYLVSLALVFCLMASAVMMLRPVVSLAVRLVKRWRTRRSAMGPSIRVMQFNVTSCVGTDGKFDIGRVAAVIRLHRPDVVALQEVEVGTTRDKRGKPHPPDRDRVNQVEKLAALTGLGFTRFHSKTTGYGGGFGNAVLSKFPIQDFTVRFTKWTAHGSDKWFTPVPQGALAVRLKPDESVRDIWVVSTQFGSDASGLEQLGEAIELTAFLSQLEPAAAGADAAAMSSWAGPDRAAAKRRRSAGRCCCCSKRDPTLEKRMAPSRMVVCGDFQSPRASPVFKYTTAAGFTSADDLGATISRPCSGGRLKDFPLHEGDSVLVSNDGSLDVKSVHRLPAGTQSHRPVIVEVALR